MEQTNVSYRYSFPDVFRYTEGQELTCGWKTISLKKPKLTVQPILDELNKAIKADEDRPKDGNATTDYMEIVRMTISGKSPKILVKTRSKISLKEAPVSPPGINTTPTSQHGWDLAVVTPDHSNIDLSEWLEELHETNSFQVKVASSYDVNTMDLSAHHVTAVRTFKFANDVTCIEAIQLIKNLVAEDEATLIDSCAFFVPVGIYPSFPNGHWIKGTDKLYDYVHQGIGWIKLRARRLTLKVVINDMDINKTFAPDPFSTVGELIQEIQQRLGEKLSTLPQSTVAQSPFVSQGSTGPVDKIPSPTQSQAIANNIAEGYGLFMTPLEQTKDFLYAIWLNHDQMLGSYDLINQGVVHYVRKEWQVKVAYLSNLVENSNPQDEMVQGTPTMKTFKVNPYWTVNELLFFILKSIIKKQSPQQSEYLLFMPFNNNNNLNLTSQAYNHPGGPGALCVNPTDRSPKLLPHPQTYEFYCGGVFLEPEKLLNHYYNYYDGLGNDIIELKRVTRTQKILFVDNTSLVLQFSELTKVEAVMDILCEQIHMTKPNNFRFMAQTQLPDGTIYERWLRSDLSFAEQRVAPNHKVFFKNKYLLSDNNMYETAADPQNPIIPLSYAQACQLVNSGRYKLPTQALFLLQSLQLQVMVSEQDPNQQAFLQQFESVFGSQSNKDSMSEMGTKGKPQTNEESIQAKLKYLQICQSPLLYDDNTLEQLVKPSGSLITFQVSVKGIYQKDQNFNKNLPVIMEIDTQKKSVTFIQPVVATPTDPNAPATPTPKTPQNAPQQTTASGSPTVGGSMFIPKEFGQQPQGSIAQTNNIILRLRLEDLKYASLKLDKGTMVTNASEKSKFRTVSLINYFDRMVSAHRTCTIKFRTYVEREFFYFLLHSFLYSTASLSSSALRKSMEATKSSTLGASVDSLGFKRVPIKVFVGTFNMGGVSLGGQDGLWIPPSTANVDLYVLGVQECWEEWNKGIRQHIANINSGQTYEVIAELQMWEMGMIVLINSKHANHVRDVQTATKPTGFASIVGNKGGVGIGFRLYETNFCFISSHLPARAERVPNRNQDFGGLVEALDLGMRKVDLVNQFHHLIWLGDLNYRVDFSREKILTLIEQDFHDGLLRGDQLMREKDKLRTFYAFNEGKIQFWPTYRYERGNNEWSKKKLKNVPSYCDRVMWRSIPGLKMHQKYYTACMELMTSDHRAVNSLFTTEVKTCIPAAPDQLCQLLLEIDTYPSFQLIFYNLELTRVEDAIEPLLTKPPNKRTSLKSVLGVGGADDVEEKKVVLVDNIILRAPFLPSVTHYIPVQRIIEGQTWRSKQELDIVGPFQCLPQSLRKEYMLVQVYSGSEDAVIGSTVIPLYDNVIQGPNWSVCCAVTYRGILWGYLTAELEIKQLTDFH